MSAQKELRVMGYDAAGNLVCDRKCPHWASVGGVLGNIIDDVKQVVVTEDGRRVLRYHRLGVQ